MGIIIKMVVLWVGESIQSIPSALWMASMPWHMIRMATTWATEVIELAASFNIASMTQN
jgi:hypothetical protein